MPWGNVQANMGRYGALWLAPQTAFGTPATVPTIALRLRQFMPPLTPFVRTADEYADKSLEQKFERVQGVQIDNRSITAEATLRDLGVLLPAMLGDVASGVLTPKTGDFAIYAPGVPLTIWQFHPGGDIVSSDVQITQLEISVTPRANATMQIGLGVTQTAPMGTAPTAATIAQDVLQYRHFYGKYDGVTLNPEGGTIRLSAPMQAVDSARGLLADDRALYPLGWERSGPRVARVEFTTAGTPAALRTGYGARQASDLKAAEFGFLLPGATVPQNKTLSLTLNPAQVKGHDPSNGLDRFTTTHAIEGVSLDGLPPFSLALPA